MYHYLPSPFLYYLDLTISQHEHQPTCFPPAADIDLVYRYQAAGTFTVQILASSFLYQWAFNSHNMTAIRLVLVYRYRPSFTDINLDRIHCTITCFIFPGRFSTSTFNFIHDTNPYTFFALHIRCDMGLFSDCRDTKSLLVLYLEINLLVEYQSLILYLHGFHHLLAMSSIEPNLVASDSVSGVVCWQRTSQFNEREIQLSTFPLARPTG
jgi:hypothetical protein